MSAGQRGKPSLRASAPGVEQAKKIFKQRRLTRQSVAQALEMDRSVVGKFLRGDKIWSQKFTEICDYLGLAWQEIAEGIAPVSDEAINELPRQGSGAQSAEVRTVRDLLRPYLMKDYGSLRLPWMDKARDVKTTYTQLHMREGQSSRLSQKGQEDIWSGEEAVSEHSHLRILGLPGSGKTTFLKYLTLRCIEGQLCPNLVPVFIPLRDLSYSLQTQDLATCISEIYYGRYGLDKSLLHRLLAQGSVFLLLDGEDEMPAAQAQTLALRSFGLLYKNRVVITCRTAANRLVYHQFTHATILPFTDNQITEFANCWFQSNHAQVSGFIEWLNTIRFKWREGFTPAENPLLLTLLCIVFETSPEEKPCSRAQIYQTAFGEILRYLYHNHLIPPEYSVVSKLPQGKIVDFLKAIAREAFNEKSKSFVVSDDFLNRAGISRKDRGNLSASDFCRQLEAGFGLITGDGWNRYRFTHLSFHEYFIALTLIDSITNNLEGASSSILFENSRLFNPEWYEVYLFVTEMLSSEQLKIFLKLFAHKLSQYLYGQSDEVKTQIHQGGEIASRVIDLFNDTGPKVARKTLAKKHIESKIVISAFCSDYRYRFDPARRISQVFDLEYNFANDLVLAHCFKCNLSNQAKQKLKILSFTDALIYTWQQADLHARIKQLETVDQVRACFFDYVTHCSSKLFEDKRVKVLRKVEQENIKKPSNLSEREAVLEKSKWIAKISNPEEESRPKEDSQSLSSKELDFPINAYDHGEAEKGLIEYYYGCTLLCDCLPTDLDSSSVRDRVLQRLFKSK